MKLISWNVNGIRAASRAGFLDWFSSERPDVVCVQEIKARPEQLEPGLVNPFGYHAYWNPASKPGYSGTAIFSRKEPHSLANGMGIDEFDSEGRVQAADFGDFVLINAYFPNSQRDHARLGYKLDFCAAMRKFCDKYRKKGKHVVLCGDYNIAHKEIDLRNPKSNVDNAGFLPEERAWLDEFEAAGYVDAFRLFEPGPDHYTWWSYRPGVREKNIGWRLDYHWVNDELRDRLGRASHQPGVKGSDHCPVALELRK
jgi:exodeoxyribonuclease-3